MRPRERGEKQRSEQAEEARTAGSGGSIPGKGGISSADRDGLPEGLGVAEGAYAAGVPGERVVSKIKTGTSGGGPVVGIPLPMPRTRVPSLIRELKSHMPHYNKNHVNK